MKHLRQLIAAMLFCTILISCAGQSGETDTTSGTEDTSETDTGTTVSSIPEPDILNSITEERNSHISYAAET